ncbi:unnamed protein product [Rotaria sp. Silwood2]|nr:unnamed protein product [Rotaria sp. Silwood2]
MATINTLHRFAQIEWENKSFVPIDGLETNDPPLRITRALPQVTFRMPDWDAFISEVEKRFPNDKQYKLTLDECIALCLYTKEMDKESLYVLVNAALRSGNEKKRNSWLPFLQLFYSAVKKMPNFQGRCWRAGATGILDQIELEERIAWSGISSCSKWVDFITKECSDKKEVLFMIDTVNAKDISKYSTNPCSLEILLMPGTHLVVKNIEPYKEDNTLTLVHLQELTEAEQEAAKSTQLISNSQFEQTSTSKHRSFSLSSNNKINVH